MSKEVICKRINDCMCKVKRNESCVTVHLQPPYVFVTNDSVNIDGTPLITYVTKGSESVFYSIIGRLVADNDCDSMYTSDAQRHLRNGYPLNGDEMAWITEITQKVGNICD